MEITLIKSPDSAEEKVQVPWNRISEKTSQALIAELYKADCITFRQAQSLLNCHSWQEAADILKNQGCELYYRDDFVKYRGYHNDLSQKGKWAQVAEKMAGENLLDRESGESLRKASREFRKNFGFREPPHFDSVENDA
jgi:hypothetical protein